MLLICKFLNRCVEDLKLCPFYNRGKSPELCGFFWILRRFEDYAKSYTDADRMLAEELIEMLRDGWLKGVERGTRAPGGITGTIFEEWLYKKLSEELKSTCILRRGERIYLRLGDSEIKWVVDIHSECDRRVTAIEAKVYFDKQHSLMAKTLLDFTDIKWAFVSLHPLDKYVEGILQHVQSMYKGRFMYSSILKDPHRAIKIIATFCKEG
ncbi:MAG: hypothetical protein B7O98_08635 [Zestosphaera tikiterensis]|uniref:Restriction endonuclease type IV Mrr domain-containing protein n=1 Tax=Zestosphaera tikiterensis TaxID=1973259 RepID=A0A2R7Y2S8_9CREN|nr:MAG: hypothetical protein B7O98_08635 [Zestosphaera tikiterensis]